MGKHFRFSEDGKFVIRSREAYMKLLTVSVLIAFIAGLLVGGL